MKWKCTGCEAVELKIYGKEGPQIGRWVRHGAFYRKSDSKRVERWKCLRCGKTRSKATGQPAVRQKRRRLNDAIWKLLSSGVSQRRAALVLGTTRKTVVRKFIFMSQLKGARHKLPPSGVIKHVYFDEMESAEHSKWKPLSIVLAVDENRNILDFEVCRMPARGREARKAVAKYGPRADERRRALCTLMARLSEYVHPNATFYSDKNPRYPAIVKKYFPHATHLRFKGRRACIAGQGELKKGGFDPLFPLNHTAAMLRANINRLFRKTWCLSKRMKFLAYHIALYAAFHNQELVHA